MQPIGRMTLNRSPTNFFAEVEQVAFHVGHLVRGIEVVDDPLMQARLFSYLDTQLTRLGGPNFSQIPINRPHRAGQRQLPRRLPSAGGAPRPHAVPAQRGRRRLPVPRRRRGRRLHPRAAHGRRAPRSASVGPDDEYAQATLFWNSMTEVEQDHIVDAYTFELGKVEVPAVVERMVARLALVDADLARRVCFGLGLPGAERRRRRRRPAPTDAERRARRHAAALDVVAGAGDGHRRHVPGRRPGRADPRQRRLRPRRHPGAAGRRCSPPARCRTWSPPTRARSPAAAASATSSPSTGRSTPRARPRPTPSSSPAAPARRPTRR